MRNGSTMTNLRQSAYVVMHIVQLGFEVLGCLLDSLSRELNPGVAASTS